MMRKILGLGVAALAGMHIASPSISSAAPARRRKKPLFRDPAPNDFGPVVDTTPESKRARRRRLARAKS